MINGRIAILGAAAAAVFAAPARAHHSFAPIDVERTVTVEGAVVEFRWTNPHGWIEIEVVDADGAATAWTVEISAPFRLFRLGWRRDDFAVGDEVVLVVHPRRDDRPGGVLVSAILADGSERLDAPVGQGER